MKVQAKICGLSDAPTLDAAVRAGAGYVGFMFFPPSPRAVRPEQAAPLVRAVPERVKSVGVFVDPDDALLERVLKDVPLDIIQLHGDEPVERVAAIKERTGLSVIKVFKIAEADDFQPARRYEQVVDYLMFDAKPPKDATRPGGNAVAFDWTLLRGQDWAKPWFLAGGLTIDNVAGAVKMTGARLVDASSGVEESVGRKNPDMIRKFLAQLA
ncbi:phosphoribosylanthranilate isomerase [Hwanghaeella sp.]|uniref:phosphoribosylanthranilate isomerase n=1 Tax=Hwanghaeella sp. TaxID=2605943 RepID=UPI003CCBE246